MYLFTNNIYTAAHFRKVTLDAIQQSNKTINLKQQLPQTIT